MSNEELYEKNIRNTDCADNGEVRTMRNVLYPKLAATNIKKNGKTYFPYLLTCILTVMMFYDLLLVSTNSALDTHARCIPACV